MINRPMSFGTLKVYKESVNNARELIRNGGNANRERAKRAMMDIVHELNQKYSECDVLACEARVDALAAAAEACGTKHASQLTKQGITQ